MITRASAGELARNTVPVLRKTAATILDEAGLPARLVAGSARTGGQVMGSTTAASTFNR